VGEPKKDAGYDSPKKDAGYDSFSKKIANHRISFCPSKQRGCI